MICEYTHHFKKNAMRKFGSQNAMPACNWKHTCLFFYLVYYIAPKMTDELYIIIRLFQTSLSSKPPDFFCVLRKNSIVIAHLFNNSLGNNIFFWKRDNFFFFFFFFLISHFTWVFIQVLSPVLPWSPGPECTEQFDCTDGFSLLICSEHHISNGR